MWLLTIPKRDGIFGGSVSGATVFGQIIGRSAYPAEIAPDADAPVILPTVRLNRACLLIIYLLLLNLILKDINMKKNPLIIISLLEWNAPALSTNQKFTDTIQSTEDHIKGRVGFTEIDFYPGRF